MGLKFWRNKKSVYICTPIWKQVDMVDVAQSVRVEDCGS